MNKKVLSAILFSALFAGTGTFTSCIDTDEPAGIEELRGAKAELLKAQAAVQLAEEAYKRAWVANQELMNEAQRLTNEAQKIDNDMKALDLQIKEAKTEAEIAGYLVAKQEKENELAVLAETFKAEMLEAQAETVKAQSELDAAIKAAEVAKLTLTTEQQAQMTAVIGEMTTAKNSMTAAYTTVVTMQDNLRKALIGDGTTITLASLEWTLLDAQNDVKVEEIAVADAEKMLALAKDFDTETWAAQLDSLRADSLDAVQKKAAAQVDLDAFYMGAEYQAAEKAFQKAVETLGDSTFTAGNWDANTKKYIKGEMNNTRPGDLIPNTEDSTLLAKLTQAKTDSIKATKGQGGVYYVYDEEKNLSTNFEIEAYASEPADSALRTFFKSQLANVDGYDVTTGVFSYDGGNYDEDGYYTDSVDYKKAVADGTLDTYVPTSAAMKSLMAAEGWLNALTAFESDTNGLAWSQIGLDIARQDSAKYQKEFEEAKAKWQILVDAINGKKTEAPTDSVVKDDDNNIIVGKDYDIETAVADYNALVDSLTKKVTEYNAVIDSIAKAETDVYDKAYAAYLDTVKAEAYYSKYYKTAKEDLNANVSTFSYESHANPVERLDSLKKYLKKLDTTNDKYNVNAKAIVDNAMASWAALQTDKNAATTYAEAALAASTATDWSDEFKAAKRAVRTASQAVDGAWENVKTIHNAYETSVLAVDYGQVFAGANLVAYVNPNNENDTIAVGTTKYTDFAEAGYSDKWAFIAKDFDLKGKSAGNMVNDTLHIKDYTGKADSIYKSKTAAGTIYYYAKAPGSNISAAELANLSVTELAKASTIQTPLLNKTTAAFGNKFDWTTTQSRLVEVTEEMVEAHATENNLEINETNYGALGKFMEAKTNVELVLAHKDADKLVEPLKEILKAQYDALKAEIAANSAIVAAVIKKYDDALLAYEAGKAMVEKTLSDRDALSAEAEAEIDLLEGIINEKKAVIQSATAQLEALFPGVDGLPGALTTEKLVQAWESKVTTAKQLLVKAEDAVARAEKEIELFKAGEYSQAYSIEYAKVNLEAAQEAYDAAVEYYEFVVAQFKALLAAYSK